MDAALSEIARFLAVRAPFDALAPEELGDLAAQTEIEFFLSGQAILTEDGGPVTSQASAGALRFTMLSGLLSTSIRFGGWLRKRRQTAPQLSASFRSIRSNR